MKAAPLRVGLVGLDSSHALWFARLLNDVAHPAHVAGARAEAAWAGGVEELPLSRDRVEGFSRQVRDECGVELLDSPEAVAERCDLVIVTAVDGRTHAALARRLFAAGKPLFVDKPLTTDLAEARALLDEAEARGVPLWSASALRFLARGGDAANTGARRLLLRAPLPFEPAMPGWWWYGLHAVETAIAVLGPEWREIAWRREGEEEVATMRFADGAEAELRGTRGTYDGGFRLSMDGGAERDLLAGERPFYAPLLEQIVRFGASGQAPVSKREMLATLAAVAEINSRRRG
jgi:Predicted dehydrogenases and related proteins